MGCRGGSSELVTADRASALHGFAHRRRTVLRLWCGVVFLALLPACSPPEQVTSTVRNILTIGFPEGEIASAETGLGQLITGFTLEGLTQVNVDGRAVPRLAQSWKWENNGLALRLTLRPDVKFHNGTALTATAAAEALSAAIARPANRALYPFLADIVGVRADSDVDLVLDLSERSAFLPEDLELPLGLGTPNVGTGPFRLAKRDADGVVLERFEDYYLGVPRIQQVVIRPFDTLRTAWSSLLRGDVDMVTDVPHDAVDFVQNGDIEVVSFTRRYQFMIAFNVRKPPLASTSVRRALNTAIDRDKLIKRVLQGAGEPATGPLWPRHWAYDATVQPFAFDPQGTVDSLEAAGFRLPSVTNTSSLPPARLRFSCLLPADFSLLERIGLEVQKQLYDVGVDMQFEVVPIQEYDSRIREGRFDAVLIDLISGPTFGRPFIFWRSAAHFQGLNVFGYENAETEKLFQALRASTNEATVRSATYRLQRAMTMDPPALFLVWNERARAVSRRFRIVEEAGRDPLHTIWQWTENPDRRPVSTQ
jgi:peptide/nickel transport system substrate-binding protein